MTFGLKLANGNDGNFDILNILGRSDAFGTWQSPILASLIQVAGLLLLTFWAINWVLELSLGLLRPFLKMKIASLS